MKDLYSLICVLEKISDDKVVEAVSCAIKIEAVIDGVLKVLFAGTVFYIACKIVKAVFGH